MITLVVKGRIPKNIDYTTFEEEYAKYARKCKPKWRTPEGFSLEFDSTLADLRQSCFIYTDNSVLAELIRKKLNVIEEIEL